MLLCACVILLVASDLGFCLDEADLDAQWEQWKNIYGKNYNNEPAMTVQRTLSSTTVKDERYRKEIWKENMHAIEVHNREAEQGKHSYKLGMNHLGDMTSKEMSEKMTCFRGPIHHESLSHYEGKNIAPPCKTEAKLQESSENTVYNNKCSLAALPKSIDYRVKGMVTPVKDQGSCGSCWAFSAAGALEGQLAKTTGQLLNLSPQNLLDCDNQSDGCEGGYVTTAFEYVEENGGINSEEDYPYMGKVDRCRYNSSAFAAQCKGFKKIPKGDECALAQALHDVGPLSVAINANHLMLYRKGVYYDQKCNEKEPNHGVLLVGYGETAEGLKYWILKNSYGTDWGDEGYIRIARDRGNHCGIASSASYPVL